MSLDLFISSQNYLWVFRFSDQNDTCRNEKEEKMELDVEEQLECTKSGID